MIHPSAVIDSTASLAPDVQVGAYSVIGPEVDIDSGTVVGPHVVIHGTTRIGRDNRIFQFSSIGDDPQDKKYGGEPSRLEIGDRNTIREGCTLNRGTRDGGGVTRIGDDNWIMAYTHVAHDCLIGNDNVMANNATLAGHVQVGHHVTFGGFSGVHQFCQIGSYAFLGMFSAVNRDIPAYCMVSGQPAVPRGVNSEGLRRHGFGPEQIKNIRRAYRLVYRDGLKLDEATQRIAEDVAGQPELQEFLDSVLRSTRSIVR
ncbi:MAG: acyl-ACP--UDP-N-acetylglucosamine O-acyltransferase [Chromatiales bacterium]|nr:acyl-ACP--UDP-N-acetylglucosamine O-acyltransferase [Chromatiales bacterium]